MRVRRHYELDPTAAELRHEETAVVQQVSELQLRMETIDTEVAAFVPEDSRWERVTERVSALEEAYPEAPTRPPLYGVPVGIKDIFHVDGLETRAGSELPPELLTRAQGTAVDRLIDAGAVVLGKTVTAEFAYFQPGPTRNPHDTAHTPGGSSSGSAAAVAAGLCPAAVGTQTIGSVIRPAAFCGVIGFKPSFGRIPTDGVIPASPAVDHVGVFTQDIPGTKLLGAVLCENWRALPEPRGKPTLGVPEGPYVEQATVGGQQAFAEQVEQLSASGFEIERVELFGDIDVINERHEQLVAAEMAIEHEEWYDSFSDRYAAKTSELIERGQELTASTIAQGRNGREQLREEIHETMEEIGVDIWLSPAAPGPAPEGINTTGDPVMNLPWTHAGLPALSVPAGTVDGLPVGLQCVSRFGGDEDLLGWVPEIRRSL